MKKKQETKTPKQTILNLEIDQTLDLLERQLRLYRQSEIAKNNLYRIHLKFDVVSRELAELKFKIKNLSSA